MNINFLNSVTIPDKFSTINISDYLDMVKAGKYEKQIMDFRNSKSLSKDEQSKIKTKIPAVTISGTFKDRVANANLLQHSGFICVDFDHIDNVDQLKELLIKDKYTYSVLYSASGNGLAALVKIDSTKHLESFNGLKNYYFKKYEQLIDPSCKNISRFRYLSIDKNLFINEKTLFALKIQSMTIRTAINNIHFACVVMVLIRLGLVLFITYASRQELN